jgi:hypothetical protein
MFLIFQVVKYLHMQKKLWNLIFICGTRKLARAGARVDD